ncbi:hypothetical protein KC950_00255 [Candidatus Saccharibacteria bacterium]|nr:hypothetical protein [Candidatus Saccharibacteria bacterium]
MPAAIAMDIFFGWFAAFFLATIISSFRFSGRLLAIQIVYLTFVIFILYLVRHLANYFAIRSVLRKRKYIVDVSIHKSLFFKTTTNDMLKINDKTDFIKSEKDYSLYDVRFDFYRKSKNGDFKSREEYHTVIEYKLRRTLPHLIFDSKTAKGRQYKWVFLKSQQLSLEGNFDKYYDLYSPMFYQIDTLSFITPDVMQTMIELSDYDLEIKDDRLIILAPLVPNNKIDEFVAKTDKLFKELNFNLRAYKDTRIESGKENIADFGRTLLINPVKNIVTAILMFIGLIMVILGMVFIRIFDEYIITLLLFLTIGTYRNIRTTVNIYKNNKSKISNYKKLYT